MTEQILTTQPQNGITLLHFEKARQELALAHSIDEVKVIRDQAEAIRAYIKQQKGSFEMQNQAAEIKLRAERRAGEMLREVERVNPINNILHSNMEYREQPTYTELLKQNDLASTTAHRWQLEAEIPEEKFEQFIAETKEKADELTSRAALNLALEYKRKESQKNAITRLPIGKFDVIYTDPPWQYDNSGVIASANSHYSTMSISELSLLPIPSADNAVLFLWVTNPFVRDVFDLLDAWGFSYKTNIVWIKTELQKPGIGFYVRGRHELLFICVRGSYLPDSHTEPISSIIESPVREHSQKPELVYDLIEKLYPNGQYLELFAREKHSDKWTAWGNEIKNTY